MHRRRSSSASLSALLFGYMVSQVLTWLRTAIRRHSQAKYTSPSAVGQKLPTVYALEPLSRKSRRSSAPLSADVEALTYCAAAYCVCAVASTFLAVTTCDLVGSTIALVRSMYCWNISTQ